MMKRKVYIEVIFLLVSMLSYKVSNFSFTYDLESSLKFLKIKIKQNRGRPKAKPSITIEQPKENTSEKIVFFPE